MLVTMDVFPFKEGEASFLCVLPCSKVFPHPWLKFINWPDSTESTHTNHPMSGIATLGCDNHRHWSRQWPIEVFQIFRHDLSLYLASSFFPVPAIQLHPTISVYFSSDSIRQLTLPTLKPFLFPILATTLSWIWVCAPERQIWSVLSVSTIWLWQIPRLLATSKMRVFTSKWCHF